MGFLYELIGLATTILGSVLILRAYLWSQAVSPSNPVMRFSWKLTDWLVNPVSYVVKPRGNWDLSSLAAALLVAILQVVIGYNFTGFPVSIEGFVLAPIAMLVRWGCDILIWALVIYVIASWLRSPYFSVLDYLVSPFLRPLRRLVPLIGRFDVTPIVLFFFLTLLLRIVVPIPRGALAVF